jgi:TrmH family RNA methyltransferase
VDLSAAVIDLQAQGVKVFATDLKAQNNIYQTDLRQPTAWLLGSEGSGVSAELIDAASAAVVIPMVAGESLNVAAAAAICLFETARQQNCGV